MVPIPNYPDYFISKNGVVQRATSRTNAVAGQILKHQKMTSGYACVSLCKIGTSPKKQAISRLILEAYAGPAPSPKHQAAHLNGNKLDNRLENLAWVTVRENSHHKRGHGTHLQGESGSGNKLTKIQIGEIQELRKSGESAAMVAAKFGVSDSLVYRLEKGKCWKHLNLAIESRNRAIGALHPISKLTETSVLQIRQRVQAGESQRSVAKAFSVCFQNVNHIINRKTWNHI